MNCDSQNDFWKTDTPTLNAWSSLPLMQGMDLICYSTTGMLCNNKITYSMLCNLTINQTPLVDFPLTLISVMPHYWSTTSNPPSCREEPLTRSASPVTLSTTTQTFVT